MNQVETAGCRFLLASCFGDDDTGGGLFAFDGQSVERVDRLSTTGLWTDSERLVRALRSPYPGAAVGELLVYDDCGVERYYRIDELSDPHDVLFDGERFVVVSSLTNSILWISESGRIDRSWTADGTGDAWHLNSLVSWQGSLLVCAFGRFREHREWMKHRGLCSGIVFDLETGRDVLSGLSCPHHPRFVDGSWVVCNSDTHELVQIDAETGNIRRRLELGGWTRGVAISDEFIFVGESSDRVAARREETAGIAIVCRRTWRLLNRLQLPSREVYDLVFVSARLAEGIRRGFRTNPLRVEERDQYALFEQVGVEPTRLWATGDPLPEADCRVQIEATVPEILEPGSLSNLECTIANLGSVILVSALPNPVQIAYRWFMDVPGRPPVVIEGLRSRLTPALPPSTSRRYSFLLQAPAEEGDYLLRLTLVQEGVAWFDDLNMTNSFIQLVQVREQQGRATDPGRSDERSARLRIAKHNP